MRAPAHRAPATPACGRVRVVRALRPLRSPSPAACRTVRTVDRLQLQGKGQSLTDCPEPPRTRRLCDLRGRPRLSWCCCSPFFARHTSTAVFAPQRSTCAPTRPPLMLPRHPVARHTCAASCQARGGEPGTLRNGSLSTLCLEMPRSAGLLSLFEHQLPPRWRMIRSR